MERLEHAPGPERLIDVGREQPLVEQRGERDGADPVGGPAEELAAGLEQLCFSKRVHLALPLRHGFIEVEDRAGNNRPGRQFGGVERLVPFRFADGQQLERGTAIVAIAGQLAVEHLT